MLKSLLALAALVCAVGLLLLIWSRQNLSGAIPPAEFWQTSTKQMVLDFNTRAEFWNRTDKKRVHATTKFFPNAPSPVGFHSEDAVFDTAYCPTCLGASGTKLFVGGRQSDGRTIIEEWTFQKPVSDPAQKRTVSVLRTGTRVLYQDDREDQRDVLKLAPMIGAPDKLLVHFSDSRELWRLSLSSASWQKVASPKDSSVRLEPGLAEEWSVLHVRQHNTEGAMYSFGSPGNDNTLTFFDSNLDGEIDKTRYMSAVQWAVAGFGDGSSYVRVFPY